MGLLGWLTLLFIFLKLNPGGNFDTPVADWSWWWVLAPTWIPLALVLAVLLVCGVVIGVLRLTESAQDKRRRKARAALRDYGNSFRR